MFESIKSEHLAICILAIVCLLFFEGCVSSITKDSEITMQHEINLAKEVSIICEKSPDYCEKALEAFTK